MRKATIVLLAILFATAIFMAKPVYATSLGFERYQDDLCEVYVEYFPIFPFNTEYPTAAEEFAFHYYVHQNDKWDIYPVHWVASDFSVEVYFRDDSCGDNSYPTFGRWYPTSITEHGLTYTWTLTGGYGPLSVGVTVKTEPSSFSCNYTEFPIDLSYGTFMHLSDLIVDYHQQWLWGVTHTEGGGCIRVPNDLAQPHEGHHVLVAMTFKLGWVIYFTPYTYHETVTFYFGDDIPLKTDCWLTVEQGDTTFYGSGGGGGAGCPTLFVWNGTDYAEEGVLDIHAGSDVTVQHRIQNALALENGVYRLQLRELDNYTSHIDQVKLYAVDNEGEWNLCPLTYAYHNELGSVKQTLLLDDSNRVDLEPTETIDMKFSPSISYSKTAYFIFEINGYNMKWPGDG